MSELKVDKITPRQGTTLTLGDAGDTINFGSGVLPNFENLTVTGDLTVDTNSLKVDSTNNFVGIGTASPSVALDVVGAITATGNITGTLATASQPNITSVGTLTSATVSGDLTVDTNTLYVDSTNNRVFMGTTNTNTGVDASSTGFYFRDGGQFRAARDQSQPIIGNRLNSDGAILDLRKDGNTVGQLSAQNGGMGINVGSSASEAMRITSSGNVGIGTSSPSSTLHVAGGATILDVVNNGYSGLKISDDSSGDYNVYFDAGRNQAGTKFYFRDGGRVQGTSPWTDGTPNTAAFISRATNYFKGNVGIGTSSPSTLLHLKGNNAEILLEDSNPDDAREAKIYTNAGDLIFQVGDDLTGTPTVDSQLTMFDGGSLIFSQSGTNRFNINTSGRVGIGETNPTGSLHIRARDSNGADVFVVTQSELNNRQSGYKCLDENNNVGLVMQYDNGPNKAVIQNSVNGNIDLYLGGTTSANVLDDYEEGTFTPTLQGSASNPSASYGQQYGRYTKIGDTVTFQLCVKLNSLSGGSGEVLIGDLPFAPADIGSFKHPTFATFIVQKANTDIYASLVFSSSKIFFRKVNSTTDNSLPFSAVDGDTGFFVTGNYKTNA